MDKAQALDEFWNSFGLPAYKQKTINPDAKLPYITYEVATGSLGDTLSLNASIWYRTTSWKPLYEKANAIAQYLYEMEPVTKKIDGGRMYITKGNPFTQEMDNEEDDSIRRLILAITVEFQTAY